MALSSVCRMCLATDVRMYPLSNTVLQMVFEKATDIKLHTTDLRPVTACYMCHSQLKKFCKFMLTSHKTERILSALFVLGRSTVLTKESITSLVDRQAHGLCGSLVSSGVEFLDTPQPVALPIKTEEDFGEVQNGTENEEAAGSLQIAGLADFPQAEAEEPEPSVNEELPKPEMAQFSQQTETDKCIINYRQPVTITDAWELPEITEDTQMTNFINMEAVEAIAQPSAMVLPMEQVTITEPQLSEGFSQPQDTTGSHGQPTNITSDSDSISRRILRSRGSVRKAQDVETNEQEGSNAKSFWTRLLNLENVEFAELPIESSDSLTKTSSVVQEIMIIDSNSETDSFTNDVEQAEEDLDEPNSHMKNQYPKQPEEKHKKKKRKWSRRNACIFCKKIITNYTRHLLRHHKNESEVVEYMSINDPDRNVRKRKRQEFTDKLRNRGNFLHNSKVVLKKEGNIILKRGVCTESSPSTFTTCKHCLATIRRKYFYRHFKNCSSNVLNTKKLPDPLKKRLASNHSISLVPYLSVASQELKDQILPHLRNDEISELVKSDPLILAYGSQLMKKKKEKRSRKTLCSKLRDLGNLLLHLKTADPSISELANVFKPQHFVTFMNCVKKMCSFNEDTGLVETISIPSRLRPSILGCTEILYTQMIMGHESQACEETLKKQLDEFKLLFQMNWEWEIPSNDEKRNLITEETQHNAQHAKKNDQYAEHLTGVLGDDLEVRSSLMEFEKNKAGTVSPKTVEPNLDKGLNVSYNKIPETVTSYFIELELEKPKGKSESLDEGKANDDNIAHTENVQNTQDNYLLEQTKQNEGIITQNEKCLSEQTLLENKNDNEMFKNDYNRKHKEMLVNEQVEEITENQNRDSEETIQEKQKGELCEIKQKENTHKAQYSSELLKNSEKPEAQGIVRNAKGQSQRNLLKRKTHNCRQEAYFKKKPLQNAEREGKNSEMSDDLSTHESSSENCEENKTESNIDHKIKEQKLQRVSKESSSNSSSDEQEKVAKDRKRSIIMRVRWTEEELNAVRTYFKDDIKNKTNPGKAKCLEVLEMVPALSRRSWMQLNTQVNNIYKKTI